MYIMEAQVQVSKWGNSLAIRLPKSVVDELGLKVGDEVELRRASDRVFEVARSPSVEEWFERVRAMGPLLPKDYEFDREKIYPRRRGGKGRDD